MSLLVTLFLVLVNIFNFVSANAPKAEGLTAVETWVVSCIIHVFGVLAEYALILKLIQDLKREELMERRKEHKRFEKQFKTEKGKQNVYQPLIKQVKTDKRFILSYFLFLGNRTDESQWG